MAATRKFDAETRQQAVRTYHEHPQDTHCSKLATRKHVGDLLGVKPATLRNWVETGAPAAAQTVAESAEVKYLKREVAELRRANEIL